MFYDVFFGRHRPPLNPAPARPRAGSCGPRTRTLLLEALEDRHLLSLGDVLQTLVEPSANVTPWSQLFGMSVAVDRNLAVVGVPCRRRRAR